MVKLGNISDGVSDIGNSRNAWYTVNASINSYTTESAKGDINITANQTSAMQYDVIINAYAEEVTNDTLGLYLSTWNSTQSGLETKVHTSEGDKVDANFTDGTTGVLYRAYKISFYLTHSNFSNPQMTETEWETLAGASTQTATFDFTYKNEKATDPEVATEIEITDSHMKWYFDEASTGNASSINYAKETTNPVRSVTTPQVKNIGIGLDNRTQAGYLFVRVEGSGWDHVSSNTYVGGILVAEHDAG